MDAGGENVPHQLNGSVRPAVKVPDPTRGTDVPFEEPSVLPGFMFQPSPSACGSSRSAP